MNEGPFFQPDEISSDNSDIKIVDLTAEPYPDLQRVRVRFRISGFQKSLGAEVTLHDNTGDKLTSANIVNLFIPHSEVTLHIPQGKGKNDQYQLSLSLFRLQEVESEQEPGKVGAIETQALDLKTLSFTLQ
jgi:hypothetical protein